MAKVLPNGIKVIVIPRHKAFRGKRVIMFREERNDTSKTLDEYVKTDHDPIYIRIKQGGDSMLKNIVRPDPVIIHEYSIDFNDADGGGFTFPCDEHGFVLETLSDAAKKNYKWCIENAGKFVEAGIFIDRKRRYREPAHGTCSCGEEVYLENQYMGACECQKCGKWYNLFGQELNPPEEWEEDY